MWKLSSKVAIEKFDVCIVAAGQPSTNPRTVKEADALVKYGYTVCVVYAFSIMWADQADEVIINNNPSVTWRLAGGHPTKERYSFLLSRLLYKGFRLTSRLIPAHLKYVINRGSWALIRETRKVEAKLYIGHNLASLPAVAIAAKKNNTSYAFDAEDYHRGQTSRDSRESNDSILIEDRYLPGAKYVSAASPLIAQKYKGHYPGANITLINNVFSLKNIINSFSKYKQDETLRLFWFSQTVSSGRGIEDVIAAMVSLRNPGIEFNILGNCSSAEKERLRSLAGECKDQIGFISPVKQSDVFSIASEHHIGLALEGDGTVNRDICLTNKIFTYLLSGLGIIATETSAQKLFLDTHPGCGKYFKGGDVAGLATLINNFLLCPGMVNDMRSEALTLANRRFNWEEEEKFLLDAIKSIPGLS